MPEGSNSGLFLLIFAALAIAAMLLMGNRQRKRQAEATAFRDTLRAGQRVMTLSGMFGTVVEVDGDRVTLAGDDGHQTRWLLAAIAKLDEDPPEDASGDDVTDEDVDDKPANPTDLGTDPR